MFWGFDWLWGLPLLALTVVVHVCALVLMATALVGGVPQGKSSGKLASFIVAITLTAAGAGMLHGLEAAVWGALYLWLGALPTASTAMLYSLGAITSYGHAEIALEDQWRILGTIEAVNGLILFGLTTAFLFAAIQEVWPVRRN